MALADCIKYIIVKRVKTWLWQRRGAFAMWANGITIDRTGRARGNTLGKLCKASARRRLRAMNGASCLKSWERPLKKRAFCLSLFILIFKRQEKPRGRNAKNSRWLGGFFFLSEKVINCLQFFLLYFGIYSCIIDSTQLYVVF